MLKVHTVDDRDITVAILQSYFRLHFQVRMFSTTTAAQAKLVKAPIQLFGVEGRYAHALYSAASKEKSLDAVEKELAKVQVIC